MKISNPLSKFSIKTQILIGFIPVFFVLVFLIISSNRYFNTFDTDFNIFLNIKKENQTFIEINKDMIELQRNVLVYSYIGYKGVLKKIDFLEAELENKFQTIRPTLQRDKDLNDRFERMYGHYIKYQSAFDEVVEQKEKLRTIRKDKIDISLEKNHVFIKKLINTLEKRQDYQSAFTLSQIEGDLLEADRAIQFFETNPDTRLVYKVNDLFKKITKDTDSLTENLTNTPDQKMITDFLNGLKKYEDIFIELVTINRTYLHLMNVVLAGKAAEIDKLSKELNALIDEQYDDLSKTLVTDVSNSQKHHITLSIIAGLIAIISSLLIAMSIVRPIKAMARTLSKLANKEQNIHIPAQERQDEIGEMAKAANAFKTMAAEQQKQSQIIIEAQRLQELVFTSLPDFLFVKDSDYRIIMANPAFLAMYPKEQRGGVIGTTTIESYPKDERDGFLKNDKIAFDTGFSEVEEKITFPNGQVKTLITKKVRFHNADNEAFILGFSNDVTDIKQYQKALITANAELEEFAYRTSHDLRSPLVSSIALLNIANDAIQENETERALNSVKHVQDSLNKLEALVKDILSLTQTTKAEDDIEDVNIPQTISETIKQFDNMDHFDRLDITQDLSADNLLKTHKSRFKSIIENLISNAIKYQDLEKEKSFIKIKTYNQDRKFIFEIEDNGLGIPKDQQDKLFTMFKRFHPKTSFGSGLGLYMMKKSADIIGAEIKFINTDKGSIFKIITPLTPPKPIKRKENP